MSLGLPYQRLLNLGLRTPLPDGGMSDWSAVSTSYVTPGFFETLRVPLLQGRTLGAAAALLLVAAAASVGPGLRVLRLDPARTLREE